MRRVLISLMLALVVAAPVLATISAARITVVTTATIIYTAPGNGAAIVVRNADTAKTIYLGGSTVTDANGYALPAGNSVSFTLSRGEIVYGIVAAADTSAVAHVLKRD